MSGLVNKVKEVLHGDSHKHDNNVPEGTAGPHSSRAANAADPRVDSDLDSTSRGIGVGATRSAGHGEYGSSAGYTGTGSVQQGNNISEGTAGPHSSRIANAADPRVDSDLDSTGRGTGIGATHTAGHSEFGSGTTGTHGYGNNTSSIGAGSGVTGVTGTHGASTGTHGPHGSRVANAADPRVDSDRDGRAALGTGPGPAPNTAGPHSNDFLNKADPRIDSDLDGSKTVGGNKTYQ